MNQISQVKDKIYNIPTKYSKVFNVLDSKDAPLSHNDIVGHTFLVIIHHESGTVIMSVTSTSTLIVPTKCASD